RREAPAELQAQLSERAVRAIRPEVGPPTAVYRSSAPGTALPPAGRAPQRCVGVAPPLRTACKARPGSSPPRGRAPTAVCRISALAANGVQSTPTGTALSLTGRAPTEGWQYQEHCRSGAPAANGVHSTPNRLTTTTRQP